MSANSFECGSFPSLGTFLNMQVPIAHNKEREQCVSLFHIVSHEFIKGRPESKGGKRTYLYAHMPLRKTSEKGTEK